MYIIVIQVLQEKFSKKKKSPLEDKIFKMSCGHFSSFFLILSWTNSYFLEFNLNWYFYIMIQYAPNIWSSWTVLSSSTKILHTTLSHFTSFSSDQKKRFWFINSTIKYLHLYMYFSILIRLSRLYSIGQNFFKSIYDLLKV